jgi:hypothetical protein
MKEQLQQFDQLIRSGQFEQAQSLWEQMQLVEKLHTVKSEQFFCFQSDYEMRAIDKGGDIESVSSFHFAQKIRSEINDISTIHKTKGYMKREKNPFEISHVREILVIKP